MLHSLRTVEIDSIPANSNPFHHDAYHMAKQIGSNCMIMLSNHDDEQCKYFIVINTKTGERMKVIIDEFADNEGDMIARIVNQERIE